MFDNITKSDKNIVIAVGSPDRGISNSVVLQLLNVFTSLGITATAFTRDKVLCFLQHPSGEDRSDETAIIEELYAANYAVRTAKAMSNVTIIDFTPFETLVKLKTTPAPMELVAKPDYGVYLVTRSFDEDYFKLVDRTKWAKCNFFVRREHDIDPLAIATVVTHFIESDLILKENHADIVSSSERQIGFYG